jgi:ubiquinone/menaquinone biosynthesis C-methylase UbiE
MNAEWYDPKNIGSPFGIGYLDEFAVPQERTEAEVNSILQIISRTGSKPHILDIAGGFGRIGSLLASSRMVDTIVDLDLSPFLLNQARQKGVTCVEGDMRYLPLTNNSFDLALIMFTSFGYFIQDDDNITVLKEASRVLRSNGVLLLDLPNFAAIKNNFKPDRTLSLPDGTVINYGKKMINNLLVESRTRLLCDGKQENLEPLILRMYEPYEIEKLSLKSGFRSVEVVDNYLQPIDIYNSRRLWFLCTK